MYWSDSSALCGFASYHLQLSNLVLTAGCRAVPDMSPADYREAVYSTFMTGNPWGMRYLKFESGEDDEDSGNHKQVQPSASTFSAPGSFLPPTIEHAAVESHTWPVHVQGCLLPT